MAGTETTGGTQRPRRKWYANKGDWALAKAAEARQRAAELRVQSSMGSYSRAARKYESLRILENEALRFDRIARKYGAPE
ncbi:MAG TPA: hypothetical protein VFQ88_07520 [Nevskiaceae bacterium]|nr:hypothetical protein [Nevskiaceae bacterium]